MRVAFIVSVLIGLVIYNKFSGRNIPVKYPVAVTSTPARQAKYSCSGKVYCTEMTSCEEAMFYQKNCPGTKMDGDADGIPCESQWCNW